MPSPRLVANRQAAAAVAGEMAAERWGLRILDMHIEDHPDNKTRFLVIGKQKVGPSGADKTSILVSTRNEPGALYRVLEPFHRHGISLTRIETRPSKTAAGLRFLHRLRRSRSVDPARAGQVA
jgi:chorismate mutase/prephenate dehydratase